MKSLLSKTMIFFTLLITFSIMPAQKPSSTIDKVKNFVTLRLEEWRKTPPFYKAVAAVGTTALIIDAYYLSPSFAFVRHHPGIFAQGYGIILGRLAIGSAIIYYLMNRISAPSSTNNQSPNNNDSL